MLTPQEVSERSFAKASFGGYNMSMVDDFLDVLTADYTALYNENAVLKSKMKVLVDKVDEYRSTEEAMRKTLLTAQRFADEMVAEAESKKQSLLQQAEADAAERLQELKKQEADEQARLDAAKAATRDYVAALKQALGREVDFIASLESISAPQQRTDAVDSAVRDIERNLQHIVEEESAAATRVFPAAVEEEPPAAEEEEPEEEPEEPTFDLSDALSKTRETAPAAEEEPDPEDDPFSTRHRINFGELRFGADYEIE